ncbi:allophanate hydrolase [Synergistales bacterium]|nr:allophanate hydrolase [Synergistales bacterium]
MSFTVEKAGMLTLVQDLGRWGHQFRGLTVSGPMDQFSLRMGNAMLGNDENDAALEVTLFGLSIVFSEERCVVLSGADLKMNIDGSPALAWTVHHVKQGSRLAITGVGTVGCRAYLCISGGVDVPLVMGSRATFTKGKIGGYKGRALAAGDVVATGEPNPLWRKSAGLVCPAELRPLRGKDEPIYASDGPQIDAFTENGVKTFYGETYTVSENIDRMGYRLDGPVIEHVSGPDIVSDGIVHGSVQVPGDGKPIVLMADRQTTGGYTKIAVVSTWSSAQLAQRLQGDKVRFVRVTEKEATDLLVKYEANLRKLHETRATYRTR